MGATAVAAAALVVAAFETVKLAVGRAEAHGRCQRGEVRHGRVLHGGGQGAFAHGGGEAARLRFQAREICRSVLSRLPRVGEALRVVVPNDVLFVPLGRVPAAPLRRAVGEVPAQQEGIPGLGARRDLPLQAERPYLGACVHFRAQFAIGGEVVPVKLRAGPPLRARPAPQAGYFSAGAEHRERERAKHRVRALQAGISHEEAREVRFFPVLVLALVAAAHRVVERKSDRYLGLLFARIAHPVAQHGHRQAGVLGIQRNKRGERFERDRNRQPRIAEGNRRQGILAGEHGALEPRQARRVVRTEPVRSLVGRQDAGLEHARHRLTAAAAHPDSREGVVGGVAFVRAVEDLPIA